MKKIVISTGGTGGHVIPAQVLYDYLSDKNDVIITSDNRGLNYLDKNLYKTKKIDVPKITKNFIDFFISFFPIHLFVKAISSKQAILKPCLFSIADTNALVL